MISANTAILRHQVANSYEHGRFTEVDADPGSVYDKKRSLIVIRSPSTADRLPDKR
jgi:hypothetical protein